MYLRMGESFWIFHCSVFPFFLKLLFLLDDQNYICRSYINHLIKWTILWYFPTLGVKLYSNILFFKKKAKTNSDNDHFYVKVVLLQIVSQCFCKAVKLKSKSICWRYFDFIMGCYQPFGPQVLYPLRKRHMYLLDQKPFHFYLNQWMARSVWAGLCSPSADSRIINLVLPLKSGV